MKVVLVAVLLAVAATSHAGISYEFRSVSSGPGAGVTAGAVEAEGRAFRLDIRQGTGAVLRSGVSLLSPDGAAVQVADASEKTFYELDLARLSGKAGAMFGPQGIAQVKIGNVKLSDRDAGSGGMLQGYQTRRLISTTECDLVIETMGQKVVTHVRSDTQRWATSALDASYMSALSGDVLKTGIAELDRLLADAHPAAGFPLRQITTLMIRSKATGALIFTTDTIVSSIRVRPIDSGRFAPPAGYKRVAGPIDALTR